MARPKYRNYGIRPKGSPEIGFDPDILIQLQGVYEGDAEHNEERRKRAVAVFNFIVKIALKILPPKQRKIFYSVWVNSGGSMSKGIMDFSRKIHQSSSSNYNNWNKAKLSLQQYLKKTGYDKHIIEYIRGNREDLE